MSAQKPSRIALPKRNSFNDSALDVAESPDADPRFSPRRPGRVSFSTPQNRPSERWRALRDEEDLVEPAGPPPIPSALKPEGDVTPLPVLSMIVLSITMLGEFLSANVSTPFVLDMVSGFDDITDKSEVAAYTGFLVSTFFLTQFLTSLLWATVADKYGQRTVLFVSLLGSAITCAIFGTAHSLKEAIAIRLLQGIFAGAIGVARGCVTFVTDPSNEGRAYAILGFCWGFGGVAGAIVGGSFETPEKKFPGFTNAFPIFKTYPYLLPTLIAAAITTTGAVLSLFLGPDAGPRGGAIQLPEKPSDSEVIEEQPESGSQSPFETRSPPAGVIGSIGRRVSKKISGYFIRPDSTTATTEPPTSTSLSVPLAIPEARQRSRSRGSAYGSAYGYGASYRNRLNSVALSTRRGSVANSLLRRRGSGVAMPRPSMVDNSDLNFAQRLLLANENAVTNIADLWVASAINADNEEVFESDVEDESADESQVIEDNTLPATSSTITGASTLTAPPNVAGGPSRKPSMASLGFRRPQRSPRRQSISTVRASVSGARRVLTPLGQPRSPEEGGVPGSFGARRASFVPAIFSNSGLRTPPALLDSPMQPFSTEAQTSPAQQDTAGLAPIMESRRVSLVSPPTEVAQEQLQLSEKSPSLASQLPIAIIAQYGLLALHTTTHDQVFLSYLVSPYHEGGLNLNPGHFAQLIAAMSLVQIVFQFYFYPNIGPPRGRFSHLAMFRIGSALFIPAYLTVTLYRAFASEKSEGNLIVMLALGISTAVRFCGNTFSYTAISILLNYMSPPHLVGYANGIAQSMVSLARFVGPILGGSLWSASVKDDPAGYPLGFVVCSAVCGLAIAHTFFIR